jgi:hypothetical protein
MLAPANFSVTSNFLFFFYRYVLLFNYFIIRSYNIISFISSFYFILNLPFITSNFFFFTNFRSLDKKLFYTCKYKRRNAFFPEIEKLQVRAAFNFIKKYHNKAFCFKVRQHNLASTLWNNATLSFLKFASFKKIRKNRILFFKKKRIQVMKNFIYNLKTNFFITRFKKKKIYRLFSALKKKGYKQLGFFFTLNIVKVIIKVFPFFNRFFIYKLITFGLIAINGSQVSNPRLFVKLGDMVRLNLVNRFNTLYYSWINRQKGYLRLLYKNLFQYFRARALGGRSKNFLQYSTLYNNLYKKIPNWLEVNYLSLSFFIIKNPNYFSYRSYYFNPFLFRLLFF